MRTILVNHTEGLLRGKSAIATAVTAQDTYSTGAEWISAKGIPHGTEVQVVNHFGRYVTARDSVVMAESIGEPTVKIKIVGIRAVEPDKLTVQDYQALGYRDQAEYQADWGEVFGNKIWLMKVEVQPE